MKKKKKRIRNFYNDNNNICMYAGTKKLFINGRLFCKYVHTLRLYEHKMYTIRKITTFSFRLFAILTDFLYLWRNLLKIKRQIQWYQKSFLKQETWVGKIKVKGYKFYKGCGRWKLRTYYTPNSNFYILLFDENPGLKKDFHWIR